MPILRLIASLGLDKTGFDAGLASASKQAAKFGSDLKSQLASSFGAAAFTALARETIAYGDSIEELASRLNLTAQEAQRFAVASKLGGADMDFFAGKFEKMQVAMRTALSGGKNPFQQFGISLEQLGKMGASDILKLIAMDIEKLGMSADRSIALIDIFGKGAGKMVNILKDFRNANSGVGFFSDSDIAQLQKADDVMVKLWNNVRVGAAKAINELTSWRTLLRSFPGGNSVANALGTMGKDGPGAVKGDTLVSGGITPEQEAAAKAHMAEQDRINAMEKRTNEINEKARVARLSTEERLNELIRYRSTLIDNLSTEERDENGLFQEGAYEMMLQLAQTNAEIEELGRLTERNKNKGGSGIEESSFGRMGAFTGAAASAAMPQQRQADLLNQIHQALVSRGIVVRDVAR